VYKSYMTEEWLPGLKSNKEAINVFQNLLLSHVLAYSSIKDTYVRKSGKSGTQQSGLGKSSNQEI